MQIIYPQEITPAILTSSNVLENDYAEWVAGTYTIGTRRIIAAQHKVYEVLAASTTDSPLVGIAAAVPTWAVVGSTNRWRMFDASVSSLTTNQGTITVKITPGKVINSIALFNLAGRSVRVTMVDPIDGTVRDVTVSLVQAGVANWYDYFFTSSTVRTDIVINNLPAYGTAAITVTIDAGAEIAAVGHMVIGQLKDIGCTGYGASAGAISFSRKDRNTYGDAIIVKRANAKRSGFDISYPTNQLATIERMLMALDAVPIVWIGSPLPEYEGTVVFGFYRDFDLNYEGPKISRGTINIEGMT